MKVLLVNGSPHKEGCTNRALQEICTVLEKEGIETEIFWITSAPLSGCIACGQCGKLHHCVFDDKVNEFSEKAKQADGFIFGTPVYYASPNGALTAFMDRLFFSNLVGGTDTFRLKPAAAVASARRAGTTPSLDQMNRYFELMQMPVVSANYWNEVHGSTPEQVEKDEEGLETMRVLARNMAWLLKLIENGKKAGIPLPEQEPHHTTNFIR